MLQPLGLHLSPSKRCRRRRPLPAARYSWVWQLLRGTSLGPQFRRVCANRERPGAGDGADRNAGGRAARQRDSRDSRYWCASSLDLFTITCIELDLTIQSFFRRPLYWSIRPRHGTWATSAHSGAWPRARRGHCNRSRSCTQGREEVVRSFSLFLLSPRLFISMSE